MKLLRKFLLIIIILSFTGCGVTLRENDKKISRYFTAKEALYSDTAKRYGIRNIPLSRATDNIYYCAYRMDKVRRLLGTPIYVNSWYRSPRVNRKVGGVRTSAHVEGLAVDFRTKKDAKYIYKKLRKSRLSYDQLIYYPRQKRFHIAFKRDIKKERRQAFIKY
ncbi:D-Ala-D-Ala carboxypeptidase family metallohydrolase [Cetobacterium sp. SF1]|uniref:D-Ala-D-Ala carboxypeptidase family metallohydrolase n=1 Tax=unclassified Cetobacterium TaxID=2630983 RepID=UPI003CFB88A2